MVFIPTAVGGDEFGGSHQKQRDSSRLTATNKYPQNLFGLEASKIAHNLRLQTLHSTASRHFGIYQNIRGTGQSSTGQRKYEIDFALQSSVPSSVQPVRNCLSSQMLFSL